MVVDPTDSRFLQCHKLLAKTQLVINIEQMPSGYSVFSPAKSYNIENGNVITGTCRSFSFSLDITTDMEEWKMDEEEM